MKQLLCGNITDGNVGLLLFRVFMGATMLTHGIPKLFGGLGDFTKMVAKMGLPAPALMALLAALAETLGAALLAVGLATRVAAFFLAITMSVAAFVAMQGKPFAARELAFFYLVGSLLFLLKGPGKWSIDALLR